LRKELSLENWCQKGGGIKGRAPKALKKTFIKKRGAGENGDTRRKSHSSVAYSLWTKIPRRGREGQSFGGGDARGRLKRRVF